MLVMLGTDEAVMSKDQGLCSDDDEDMDVCSPAVQHPAPTTGKRKRTRARYSRPAQKQMAREQNTAKDMPRHTKRAAYTTTRLKVDGLPHSVPAYTGNVKGQGEMSLGRELGTGYTLLQYIPGHVFITP